MKQLLLKAAICCAVLSPITSQAATFGDFKPGQTFTLTVSSRSATKIVGSSPPTKSAIPPNVPKFTVGQKVKFTIGAKGELIGSKFSMTFKPFYSSADSN